MLAPPRRDRGGAGGVVWDLRTSTSPPRSSVAIAVRTHHHPRRALKRAATAVSRYATHELRIDLRYAQCVAPHDLCRRNGLHITSPADRQKPRTCSVPATRTPPTPPLAAEDCGQRGEYHSANFQSSIFQSSILRPPLSAEAADRGGIQIFNLQSSIFNFLRTRSQSPAAAADERC